MRTDKAVTQHFLSRLDEIMLILLLALIILVLLIGIFLFWFSNNRRKYDGSLIIKNTDDGKTIYSLELDTELMKLELLDIVIFKVVDERFE